MPRKEVDSQISDKYKQSKLTEQGQQNIIYRDIKQSFVLSLSGAAQLYSRRH